MDGIAIIGMAGRFPGAATPQQFWQNLCNGVESIRFYTEAELLALGCSPTLLQNLNFVPAAATVDEVEWFDADFFGYAPREVSRMDPQQRLLLECAWEAIESAGYDPLHTPGATGIFASCAISTYLDYSRLFGNLAEGFYPLFIGNAQDYATSRVAYKLNLRGPSITLMTACSSSLIAVHLAVQSILNGECDMALAGGASIRLTDYPGYFYEEGGTASPDGHCRAFDAAGQGTVFGNGLGLVLLKSLEEALADGDPIYAVIRGSATNNDGSDKMGFTAPSINGQAEVIAEAMAIAEVEAEDISYIEAHGTGTSIGDPIEVAALTRVFRAQTDRTGFCGIGSVKTNIGHLDVAAGIANLMKTALALHHKVLPPSLHFQAPNPKLNLPDSPFYVNTTCKAWTTTALPRRAGVSSFGLGGTNAHAILEEAPTRPRPVNAVERPQHLLTLSAKTAPALQAMIARYRDFLTTDAADTLADICYTSHVGRHHFAHRCTVTGASPEQMVAKLNACLQGDTVPGLTQGTITTTETPAQIAFLFTGQGAQFVNMGRELYATHPTFRAALDRCDQLLRPHLGESILAVLYPEGQKTVGQRTEDSGTGDREGEQATGASSSIVHRPSSIVHRPSSIVHRPSSIDQTAYTQPALFALEYALAQLWQSWGVTPDLVIGHSVGEYVAACLAGVFSLEDGLKLIAARSRLMGTLPQDGAMVSLQADETRVQAALAAYATETPHPGDTRSVSVAAVNGPESTVISGQREAVLAIADQLAAEGVKTRQLTVSHAFHSPLMEPMLAEFRRIAAGITYHSPKLRLVSNVTGKVAGEEVATPAYWVRHVRDTVRFADGIQTLQDQGATIYLEIGPKPTLLGMAQAIFDFSGGPRGAIVDSPVDEAVLSIQNPKSKIQNPLLLPSLREGRSDWQQMLESLGALYGQGVAIDWAGFDKDYARRKCILPTYPFQRQRYWRTTQEQPAQQPVRNAGLRPLIDKMIKLPAQRLMVFETECTLARQPYLIDHVIYGRIVVAGAFHIAMVLNAVAVAFDEEACQLQDVAFLQALTLAKDETRIVQLHLQTAGDTITFQVLSYNDTLSDEPITHVTGNLVLGAEEPAPVSIPALRAACAGSVSQETIFTALADFVAFGPSFQWSDEWCYSTEEGLARMRLPDSPNYQEGYQLFPGLIDSCIVQPMCAYYFGNFNGIQWAVPFSLDRFTFFKPKQRTKPGAIHHQELWCYGQPATPGQGADTDRWNYRLVDSEGRAVAHLDGLLRRVSPQSAFRSRQPQSQWFYQVQWQATPQPMVSVDHPPSTHSCWLIFGDQAGLSQALIATLQAQGDRVILVRPAETIASTNGHLYQNGTHGVETLTIDPKAPADYQRVLDVVQCGSNGQGATEVRALYLWGGNPLFRTVDVPTQTTLLCGSLLHLVQALTKSDAAVRLWVVTQDSQAIPDHSVPLAAHAAAQGALWGLGRTIAREAPQLHCTCLDLSQTTAIDEQVKQLLSELQQNATTGEPESQLAYRAGVRYVARLVNWQPTDSASPEQATRTLHPDGSYLITGGLGGLGLQVAQQLVHDGARHLVLTSRRGVVDPISQSMLDLLTKAGAQIQVLAADVADADAVAAVVAQCNAIASLRGIIHAAGVLDDGILEQQTWARFERVLAAKVQGTWHLHQATQALPLDFFVCFSSVSATFGNTGQGNYAAANAFMDTLMQQRWQAGQVGLSLNWGPWAEVGMAAANHERMKQSILEPIWPQQGQAILSQLLHQPCAQVAIIPVADPLPAINIPALALQRKPKSAVVATPTNGAVAIRQQLETTAGEARLATLTAYLRTTVATALGLDTADQLDGETGFFSLGLDSLMALEVRNKLATSLGVTLRSTLLFDYPSIDRLSTYLLQDVLKLADGAAQQTEAADQAWDKYSTTTLEQTAGAAVETLSGSDLIALIARKAEDLL